DAHYKQQHWFHQGDPGYIRVAWTIGHLRGSTMLAIERRYFVPERKGWKALPPLKLQRVQAVNGNGSQDSPFFAPRSYRAYEIVARILFRGRWSSPKSTTIQVR
ncbi:MAG: hypothetical protein JOZ41_12750, partial [Chloroflexi bacterium]|nr:hypothetical protein [Chloroflexota bacterium]